MHICTVATAPHGAEHLAVRDQLAGVLEQVHQQPELGGREVHLGVTQIHTVFVQVSDEIAMLNAAGLLAGRRRRPAQRRFDPGHQLWEAQGLGDVVVRAELEPTNLVGLRTPRGGHDDRHPTEFADTFDHLPAVEARQRDVEHDQVWTPFVELAERLVASAGDDQAVASLRDPALQERGELRLVLDDQDALAHARRPPSNGSVKLTRVPARRSGRSPSQSLPPWASTRRRQMYRPSPVPWMRDSRTLRARWNGSSTRVRSASGMPTPSSSTVAVSQSVDAVALMVIGVPGGAYLRALPTRFSSTCPTRAASTSSGGRSSAKAVTRRPSWPVAARSPRRRATSDANATGARSRMRGSAWSCAMSRISLTSVVSRCVAWSMRSRHCRCSPGASARCRRVSV